MNEATDTSFIVSGPWPKGMFVGYDKSVIPLDGLAEAANVNIIGDGVAASPLWWEKVNSVPTRDLFAVGANVYAVHGEQVGYFNEYGVFNSFGVVANSVDWCYDAGVVYFCTAYAAYRVVGDVVELLDNTISQPTDDEFVYESIGGGQFIAMWQGRLCIADGNVVKLSQPFRYGVYNPIIDVMAFESRVIWMRSLPGSLWVALGDEIIVVQGGSLESAQITRHRVATAPGMALVTAVPLPSGVVQDCVVCFTQYGFALGLMSGEMFYPQFGRVKDIPLYAGKLSRVGDRLFAFVHGG